MTPALSIGLSFLSCLIIANIASRFKFLPKVTIYIAVGIIFGPSLLNYISDKMVGNLYILKEVALGILLFTVGQEFTLQKIKKIEKKVILVSLFEILATLILVAGGLYLYTKNFSVSIFAGIIATATAPASTLIVLIDQSSDGKLTTYIKGMILINNLFALVMFILFFPFIFFVDFGSPPGGLGHNVLISLWEVFGSVIIGVCIGLIMALWEVKEHKDTNKVMLGFTAVIIAIGLTKVLNLVDMIVFLSIGITYANAAIGQSEMKGIVKKVELPFYVLFFILSGAALHISEIKTAGILGILYIALRTFGKYFGIRLGCNRRKLGKQFTNLLSISMFSHSAIAIGITGFIIVLTGTTFKSNLINVVLASVAIFELAGPVLVKIAVMRSGESTIANVMKSRSVKSRSSIRYVVREMLISLGIIKRKQKNIQNCLIKDTSALNDSTNFKKVLKFIEHSHFDVFPVVDDEGYFVGTISYFDIQDIAFDPFLTDIVTAVDLMVPDLYVDIDLQIEEVISTFKKTNNAFLPAIHIEDEKKHFVGYLSQRDLLSLQVNE